MTLAELRNEAARYSGLFTPGEDRLFPAVVDNYLNRANQEVSIALDVPVLNTGVIPVTANPIPLPVDARADGLIALTLDPDIFPATVPVYSPIEVTLRWPSWRGWPNGTPVFALSEPTAIRLVPNPVHQHTINIEYRGIPTAMVNDTDRPFSGHLPSAASLVAIQAAMMFCETMMFREVADKNMSDRYASRYRLLHTVYTERLGEAYNRASTSAIVVRNEFY